VIKLAWLVPFCPLLGAIVAAVGGRRMKTTAHVPVIAGIGAGFFFSLLLLFAIGDGKGFVLAPWIDSGDLHIPIELRVDGLTTMMLSMVTFVATLVAIFAAGYMAGDPGYPRFFATVGLFVFSMTGLVLSSNFVLTYAFWEGVGVCSYLLVGFWHAKPSAAAAAKKAFLVNRLGDTGFAIALFWLWSIAGHDLSYDHILSGDTIGRIGYTERIGIGLLLFWAATAKSAQIPLYVWLPDAMEGPTPVSALIHAATMVTAGVYLIARSSPLIMSVQIVPLVIAITGCATALLAALIALTQTDLKRVLAYSTISQLGYMFMALGAGVGGVIHSDAPSAAHPGSEMLQHVAVTGVMQLAVVAAMFHLFTHAFFKALLFLASGSVMHSMGGVIDMRRFRGLRHRMPYTCWTFAVGGLALSGIFPFAGFFSKDEILSVLKLAAGASDQPGGAGWGSAYLAVYWVAILTALLTAFYTGRAFFLTFFGPEKLPSPDDPEADPSEAAAHGAASEHAHKAAHAGAVDPHRPSELAPHADGATVDHAHQEDGHSHGHGHDSHFGHESPPIMWVPLVVLAACALLVGILFGPTGFFEHHLLRTPQIATLSAPAEGHGTDWVTMGVGTLAALLGLGLSWLMYGNPNPIPDLLARTFRQPYQWSFQKFGVDEFYEAFIVAPTRGIAWLSGIIDTYVIDNLVEKVALLPRVVGRNVLAPLQNGLIQFYAAVTAFSVALLLLILLFF
jgi:NADH-quinone oxidoreductase subunit L